MKIQEIIDAQEDWKPGSLRLRGFGWDVESSFAPYYFCESDNLWYGTDEDEESMTQSTIGDDWEVCRETVKHWLWVNTKTRDITRACSEEMMSELNNYIKIPGTEVEL